LHHFFLAKFSRRNISLYGHIIQAASEGRKAQFQASLQVSKFKLILKGFLSFFIPKVVTKITNI
jgi:hypothetical protein